MRRRNLLLLLACCTPASALAFDDVYEWKPKCSPASIPGLTISPEAGGSPASAAYKIPAISSTPGHSADLFVYAQKSAVDDWDGIFAARFAIDVTLGEASVGRQARTAKLLVDGKPVRRIEVHHEQLMDGRYRNTLRVETKNNLYAADAVNALSAGARATLVVLGPSGAELGRYEFDVSRMRSIPPTLLAARWQCREPLSRDGYVAEEGDVPAPGTADDYYLDHADTSHALLVHGDSLKREGNLVQVRRTTLLPGERRLRTGDHLHSIVTDLEVDCDARKSREVGVKMRVYASAREHVLRAVPAADSPWTDLKHGRLAEMVCGKGIDAQTAKWTDLGGARLAYHRFLEKLAVESGDRNDTSYHPSVYGTLAAGKRQSGTLGGRDADDVGGYPRDRFKFTASAGKDVRVTVDAGRYTPYLRVVRWNKDAGREELVASSLELLKSARTTTTLAFVAPTSGEFWLEVNTLEGFDGVDYSVLLETPR